MSRPLAFVVASALLLSVCSGYPQAADAAQRSAAATPVVARTLAVHGKADLAALRYGAVPTRNRNVVYQPNVVIVDGGASAVRSVSGDGLTWTIKGDAGHAHDLAVGKILFVTSRSAGRILALRHVGKDLAVIIGPVSLTDVIKKANVTYNEPLDPTKMIFYAAPHQPGDGGSSPVHPAAAVARPLLAADAHSVGDLLPLPTFGSAGPSVVRGMSLRPLAGLSGLGTQFDYNKNGILLRGKAVLHLDRPTVEFHLVIDDGVTSASLKLEGAAGLSLALNAAINAKNLHEYVDRFDLPIDISIPIGGPVPLTITIRQTMQFRTGFGAAQATLNGAADMKLSGGFGVSYRPGRLGLEAPLSFSGIGELARSINGVSVGLNAILVDYQIRVVVGIGAWGFAAGASFVLVSTVGITNTATEAAVPCRHADINVRMGVGIGYSIPLKVVKAINFLLGLFNIKEIKASDGVEHFEKLIGASLSLPDTQSCKI